MEESFKNLVAGAKSILIILPKTPYFDQVAAALSLYLSLRDSKDVSVVCRSPMVVEFNRLIGVDKISTNLGNKNLIVKFSDYVATEIERVTYDVVGQEFRLTVFPKPGVAPPREDQITASYAGVNADLVVLVGGANESHFPELSDPEFGEPKIAHIGTFDFSSPKRTILSFAKAASSTSEIVATIIKGLSGTFDSDVATNLLSGIYEGSRNFTGQNVTSTTHEIVAELMKAGGRRDITTRSEAKRAFPPGSIPGETPRGEVKEEAPKSWMEPKIFKGTSIS